MTAVSERLDAIEARKNAATPGPWEVADDPLLDGDWMVREVDPGPDMPDDVAAVISHEATAGFIAHAPQDITDLLDLARKQQAALDAVRGLHAPRKFDPVTDGVYFGQQNMDYEICHHDEELYPCTTIRRLEAKP